MTKMKKRKVKTKVRRSQECHHRWRNKEQLGSSSTFEKEPLILKLIHRARDSQIET
jgi:hypothetical protein